MVCSQWLNAAALELDNANPVFSAVFLGEDNSVKLGDFGLSKMIKSQDFASTYVGTPFYMSPEICAAEKYTLKSDIWSLGCIIYELCAREPPFNAKTHFQLVQRIKEGKVAPLPEIYSPELNQVIKDCLRVNPDRRPDTAQLLHLPVVKLMRKEKEVVDLNKALKTKEEELRRKEKEVNDRLLNFEKERQLCKDEIDGSLRREWEVKARLEIDRLVNVEIEKLQKRFDNEVKTRVDAELQKKSVSFAPETTQAEDFESSGAKSDYPRSSMGTSGDEYASNTDNTDYSIDSPDTSKEIKKSNARTPFCRAQTMFVGHAATPMDVEMASPSPMAISSLSLSPRRNGTTKAPVSKPANIFAANAAAGNVDPRWELHREPTLLESDDDDIIIPSPTRQIKSVKNPFTSKTRPVLSSQKSLPGSRLRHKTSNTGLVSKATGQSEAAGGRSPSRSPSKIPQTDGSTVPPGLARKPSMKKLTSGDTLTKTAVQNTIRGRTLVELQQARTTGRPNTSGGTVPGSENPSPKRATLRDRVPTGEPKDDSVAIWDPECDDMPSPFLNRQRRVVKA